MFRLLIPTLALLSVLGHSMFGCCWHHVHISEKKVSSNSEIHQPKTSAYSHHHHPPFHRHEMTSSNSLREEDRNQSTCHDECCNYTLFLEQGLNKVCDTSIEKDASPNTICCVVEANLFPLVYRRVRKLSNTSAIVSCALPSQVSQI